MSMHNNNLPFPRGTTWSDGGGTNMTIANISIEHLVGAEFCVKDSQHSTGVDVVLRLLKNTSGAAITFDNQLVKFGTDAGDYGRYVDGNTSTKGAACIPIDDAYSASFSIPANDYFYGVVRGPCNIKTENGTIAHPAGCEVVCDDSGYLYEGTFTAGEFIVGVTDAGGTAAQTAVLIWVDLWLGGPRGS